MTEPEQPADAAWYWRQAKRALVAWWVEHPDDPGGGPVFDDLCTQADQARVTGHLVDLGGGVTLPLRDLLAPYRRRTGG